MEIQAEHAVFLPSTLGSADQLPEIAEKSEQFISLIMLHTRFSAFRTKEPNTVESNRSVMGPMAASEVPREVFKGVTGKPRENKRK